LDWHLPDKGRDDISFTTPSITEGHVGGMWCAECISKDACDTTKALRSGC